MAWPTPDGWREAIAATTLQVITRTDILEPSGALAARIYPTSCSVDVDGGREVRRILTMGLPADVDRDLLDPRSRREVRCWRGVVIDGLAVDECLVPLGTFSLKKPQWKATAGQGGVVLSVTGNDRSRRLARARWVNRFPIASGTSVSAAIAAVLDDRAPWLPYDLAPTDVTTPAMWLGLDPAQSDPWQDIKALAQSAAQEVVIDPMGTLTTRPVPDPATAATVAAFLPGPANTLTAVDRGLDDEDTYNGVILTAEGSGVAALRSEVWDTDPGSLTYRATYGDVPYYATTNVAPDQGALDAACAAMFRQMVGLTEQVHGDITPDPSLDAGDLLEVSHPGSGTAGKFLLDSFTIAYDITTAMPLTLRERRTE